MLYNPVNWMQVIKSESLNEAVLIRPQKIKMGLRTGIPFAFNIESKERDDTFAVQNLGTASQFLHVSVSTWVLTFVDTFIKCTVSRLQTRQYECKLPSVLKIRHSSAIKSTSCRQKPTKASRQK
jgi:hypothetical protein